MFYYILAHIDIARTSVERHLGGGELSRAVRGWAR